jgi:hypothetical protein
MKYLKKLDNYVMDKIRAYLPTKFGLIFDGWSSGTTHYVAVYAVFPDSTGKREQVMLVMQPLPDESNQTADNHADLIRFTLESYSKSMQNVLFICGDNCNTNKKLATDLHVPLIGCCSHLFNLAVENYITANFGVLVDLVGTLSGKLRNRKAAGKLRQLGCTLQPICRNATRWSSAFAMIKRYRDIKVYVNATNFPDLVDIIPTPSAEATIEGMFPTFEKLQSITVALQSNDLRLSDARALHDAVIDIIPSSRTYLAPNAAILHTSAYQSAIVKVQNEQNDLLTREEESYLLDFKTTNVETDEEVEVINTDFASQLLRARKKGKTITGYINLDWIPPTSNVVERLFSLARLTFTDYRQAALPENLEATLFLKVNAKFWDVQTVSEILAE